MTGEDLDMLLLVAAVSFLIGLVVIPWINGGSPLDGAAAIGQYVGTLLAAFDQALDA